MVDGEEIEGEDDQDDDDEEEELDISAIMGFGGFNTSKVINRYLYII
jgi:hypothetical protein